MLTLLRELYTVIKCFKIAQNQVNSIDYMISNLSILILIANYFILKSI